MCFILLKTVGYEEKCGKFVYLFCPNIGIKFHEPYHSNHVIPCRVVGIVVVLGVFNILKTYGKSALMISPHS